MADGGNHGLNQSQAAIVGRDEAMNQDVEVVFLETVDGRREQGDILPDTATQGHLVKTPFGSQAQAELFHQISDSVMETGRDEGGADSPAQIGDDGLDDGCGRELIPL